MNAITYEDFLASKAPRAIERGLSVMPTLSSHLFPFQKHCVETMLRIGAGGLFLDTGRSEGFCALSMRRRFIGVELKDTYFRQAVENLRGASAQTDLFVQEASA